MFNCGPAIFCPIQAGEDAVLWSAAKSSALTVISNGGSTVTKSGSESAGSVANIARSSGKRYFEIKATLVSSAIDTFAPSLGFVQDTSVAGSASTPPSTSVNGGVFATTSQFGRRSTNLGDTGTIFTAWSTGAVIRCALDLDTFKAWIGINNAWITGDPVAGTSPYHTWGGVLSMAPFFWTQNDGTPAVATLSGRLAEFSYLPPAGFQSWGSH